MTAVKGFSEISYDELMDIFGGTTDPFGASGGGVPPTNDNLEWYLHFQSFVSSFPGHADDTGALYKAAAAYADRMTGRTSSPTPKPESYWTSL